MGEICGALIVDKPAGMTSHDVVGKCRRLFGLRAVGHTGTLDPDATGVMCVLLGRATKAAELLTADTKDYEARLKLGIVTDTQDMTGSIISKSEYIPSYDDVLNVIERFKGKIKQTPPMYSALKIGGRKLVDMARKGQSVEIPAREVEITKLKAYPTERDDEIILQTSVSSGTYIRTLCHDIGDTLGCGGAMASLRRTRCGAFTLDMSVTLDQVEEMSLNDRLSLIIPAEKLFERFKGVTLPPFFAKLSHSGAPVYQKKIGKSIPFGEKVRLYDEYGFYGIGEGCYIGDGDKISEEGEPGIRVLKLFRL